MGSDGLIIENQDDFCPEHPDNRNDSYPHKVIHGQCVHCEGWLRASEDDKPECNGICLTPADIGLPEYSGPGVVAYPHPDCPEHGDPLEDNENADTCGGGVEDLRYVREEDVIQVGNIPPGSIISGVIPPGAISSGFVPRVQYTDEAAHFAETGELFTKPEDYDQAELSYRIKLVSCHDSALIERTLDAAEMNFMRSLAKQINGLENGGYVDGCVPTLLVCQRVKPGDLDDDDNFRPVIEP